MNLLHLLPSECNLWTNLKRLDLSRNNLTALHVNFQELIQLKYLRLNYNRLLTFPDVVLSLTKLKILNLSKNRIHSIPGTISCMYFLKELNLNDNVITELPEELRFCTSLHQLMLVRNHIQFIPSSLSVMKNLLIEIFDGMFYALPLSPLVQHSLHQKFQDEEILATFDIHAQTITHAMIPANKFKVNDSFMAELFFVTRMQYCDDQFTSGCYYFSSSMQIQENIASFKVSSVVLDLFMLNGLSLVIQIWIKMKTESKLLCSRDIKLLPSMCSGVPFVLNMNEIVSVNETGSFMTTFGVVTQSTETLSGAFKEKSHETVSQLIQESLNSLLPEWSSLDLLDAQLSHLLEIDAEAYEKERSSVKKCISSSISNRRIQLNGTVVWTLPESLCSCALFVALESLELCFCPMQSLPAAVSHLVNLKILNLASNQLRHISIQAFPMLKLEFLELQKNSISELPESLGSCYKLKSIDVSMNLLQSLPISLGICPLIETFDFAENPMSCLPNAIFSKDIVGVKAFLHSLFLQFSKCIVSFQDFGLNVFLLMPNLSWESVRELDLGKNCLVNISENVFSRLHHLQILDLSDNPVVVFPALWNCPSLSRVLLHHTQISDIPRNVSQLQSLEYLDLSWCHLSEIVEHIAEIPALKRILLSGNMFEGSVTLNLPVSCTCIDLYGASLSSLKFQSEARRSNLESAKQDLVKRFGKTLLRKTQENTRFVQGHIYRDEHLSDIELSQVNASKVDSLRMKLGLTRQKRSNVSTIESSSQTATRITQKRNLFDGNRLHPHVCSPCFAFVTFFLRIHEMLSPSTSTITMANLAHNDFQNFPTNLAQFHPVEELDM